MANYDIQRSLVEAVEIVVDSKLDKVSTTSSQFGIIVEDPNGFDCKVKIGSDIFSCQLPEHLHTWIQKNDIVIVQDLYGNGSKKIVTGKTGSVNQSPSLVFHDEESGKLIGGVDMVFDENSNEKIDTQGTV